MIGSSAARAAGAWGVAAALWGLLSGGPAGAERIEATAPAGPRPYSEARDYIVYAPANVAPGAALVTLLHGCKQTNADILADSAFPALADRNAADDDPSNDLIILAPFVTRWDGWRHMRETNCWGFWYDEHVREGSGEVGDLRAMIDAVERAYGADPNKRFVAGLSSGAAMAVALGVAYSEDVAAVASVAGLSYGEDPEAVSLTTPWSEWWFDWFGAMDAECAAIPLANAVSEIVADMAREQTTPEERRRVPLLVVHSRNDCRVKQINAVKLREGWLARHGLDAFDAEREEVACGAPSDDCRLTRYARDGRTIVATALYDGRRFRDTHYWVGDNAVSPFANATGPSATRLIWAFFERVMAERAR